MYKLIRTVRNEKTKRPFIKEIKMIDKIERIGDRLKIHFECGGAAFRTKERIEKHCGIIGTMTQEEIKREKEKQEEIQQKKQELMLKLLYVGGL